MTIYAVEQLGVWKMSKELEQSEIKYKGYTFKYCIDEENGVLFGEVLGINDVVTFQADNVAGLLREFKASVDDYLELCEESGVDE